MRFYTQQHQFYCGIDLHARTMQPDSREGKTMDYAVYRQQKKIVRGKFVS